MNIFKALTLVIVITTILSGCASVEKKPKLRPVRIKESEHPLKSEPSEYTIIAKGKVTDITTREEIPSARIIVVTVTGTYKFEGSRFEVSFPAMSVVNIRAEAPGYVPETRQLKAHYKRNATLNIEIPLEPKKPTPEPLL